MTICQTLRISYGDYTKYLKNQINMDGDAPSLVVALIINVIIFIVVPLVMAYRRGYFFNSDEHFNWTKRVFKQKNQFLPLDWTLVGLRQLSEFEKYQIQKIVIKLMPYDKLGYRTIVVLKRGKTLEYILGENKGYWIDDVIHKDNILLRTWQKGTSYKYDVVPIKDKE